MAHVTFIDEINEYGSVDFLGFWGIHNEFLFGRLKCNITYIQNVPKFNDKMAPGDRRKAWLEAIERTDLLMGYIPQSIKVCSLHFEDSLITDVQVKKLSRRACPTKRIALQSSNGKSLTNDGNMDKKIKTKNLSASVIPCEKYSQTMNASFQNDTPTRTKIMIQREMDVEDLNQPKIKKKKFDNDKHDIPYITFTTVFNRDNVYPESHQIFNKLEERIRAIRNKYNKNQSDPDFLNFTFNLHLSSPPTYHCFKSTLNLPNVNSIKKINLNIKPGFDQRILQTLKAQLATLPESAKYCTLCFGEITLYKSHDGTVQQALVIILQGVTIDWKLPVAYTYIKDTVKFKDIDEWVTDIIFNLQTLGLNIIAVVSHEGMRFDVYAKRNRQVTLKRPYLQENVFKIYYIQDVKQLLKSILNKLKIYDFVYNGEIISWDYIEKMNTYERAKDISYAVKVCDANFDDANCQNFETKNATQIFSRAVHSTLNAHIQAHVLSEEATATSQFVKTMNDLYDVLNSPSLKINDAVQHQLLNDAKKHLDKVSIKNRKTGVDVSEKPKVFKNLCITIVAFNMLFQDLAKLGFESLCLRRFNLDNMQKFLLKVRPKAKNSSLPTTIEFKKAFGTTFVENVLKNSLLNKQFLISDLLFKN